ncbi:MAG: hypothetical protein A3K13_11700 [Gemmatimonadetes bacterium RIFCSPLOWO2_12_FULL_68_9]|uniref:PIN domain-containing protein n=1 Tax=uncultured Gemmatimonadetes bacterium Rifle_16ft_4_minimus_7 TaxID=1665098 RepID=A0A0H4TDR3_9BACT|nr:hypothetical protein [uncultured Gemmatimonadetes bacterium Rifle_16ft_4_minimus_7]OGU11906.1 MAG: hypothetical protein A3K13_11700 [Gemmatimonadetes bacterium RIFCSPLOWO2_12_FULL_68_9]
MRLLLDTHIWLWSLADPDQLAPRVRAELAAAGNELWLSPISVWEALMMARQGRLTVEGDPARWIEDMLRATPRREAPLTTEVAIASQRLDLPHRDPADRFIAATANVYDLTLVTADERLLHSGAVNVLPNR